MSSKSEKAKGILVSLIRAYLVQVSVSVQKLTVDKGSMHKDVREAFVSRLDNIWKSVMPRQVGSYDDKLYKQISSELSKQFDKHECWLVAKTNPPAGLGAQLHTIVFGEEPSSSAGQDGELVLFAKILEFLSASLRYNKTLMVEIVKFISPADMTPDVRKSVNDAILKAMNDFSATVVSHQAKGRDSKGSRDSGREIPSVEKIREELQQEFHQFYSDLSNEKIAEYKKKMQSNVKVLTERNHELEIELKMALDSVKKLRSALEDTLKDAETARSELISIGGLRPTHEARLNFGSSLEKILNEDVDISDVEDSDVDGDELIDFAFEDEADASDQDQDEADASGSDQDEAEASGSNQDEAEVEVDASGSDQDEAEAEAEVVIEESSEEDEPEPVPAPKSVFERRKTFGKFGTGRRG